MQDRFDLQRFVTAQDADGSYCQAVAELRRGQKSSHWMWYVFPQIAGLGHSAMSKKFALASLEEAREYLRHPVLGPRLIECVDILLDTEGRSAGQIFGGIDAQKLQSSMTLFMRAQPEQALFSKVLDRYFEGIPDSATDRSL
jgi:uncharacterized protein (DUF1810 family)